MQDWTIQQDSLLEDIKEAMSDEVSRKRTGEQKLQFAALGGAGIDLNRLLRRWKRRGFLGKRDQHLWKENIQWFFSSEEEHPWSFLGICSSLKLEPRGIREQIQQLRNEVEGAA